MALPLLSFEHFSLAVETAGGPLALVRDLSFSLGSEEVLALVGESGSGKTLTALSAVRLWGPNGASNAFRADGRISLTLADGATVEILDLPSERLASLRGAEVGVVFQDPLGALNPAIRIGEQIAEGRRRHIAEPSAVRAAAVIELAREVGFARPEPILMAYPHQLSGGMRQRAMIAIALAAEPRLLIADEPTTALDASIQAQVLDTLIEIKRRRRMSVLLITHDLATVAKIADRVAVMYCGRIVELGATDEVLKRPSHPYTADLLASLPRLLPDPPPLTAIRGVPADAARPPAGCAYHPRCPNANPGDCATVPPPLLARSGNVAVACHEDVHAAAR